MSDEARSTEPGLLAEQIEASLNALENSLADAGRAVAQVRHDVAQVITLADVVRDLEATINRAKGLGIATSSQPPLRAVPPVTADEPEPAPPAPAPPEAAFAAAPEPAPTAEQPSPASAEPAPSADQAVSHCLRVGVSSKTGSLDLKAVDGSVNENPAVVDVALLDYDGRQATLKLWINNQANPQGVRDALLASLRSRLGDERDADVHIDFEEAA